MISPTSIAIMVGVMGAYAASHAVGIGFIADASMLIGGGVFLGWQAVDVAKDLWAFAQYVNATTEEELDKAADHLAKAITTVGLDVILGILTKKAATKTSRALERTDVAPQRRRTPVRVEDLKQVDTAYAHHDGVNSNRVNDIDNANVSNLDGAKTLSNLDEYEYLEGINFKTDQPNHLTAIDKFTQKNGVGGAHTTDSFNQAVKDYNLKIVSKTEHPTVKGIYQIEYEIPLKNKKLEYTGAYKKVDPKTVYDPNIISTDEILEWGQQAANNGLKDAIANNRSAFNSTVNGIEFRVYVDLKTKTIRNFHPKLKNE